MSRPASGGEWVSLRFAADFLRVTRAELKQLVETGELTIVQCGRSRKAKRSDLDRVLARRPISGDVDVLAAAIRQAEVRAAEGPAKRWLARLLERGESASSGRATPAVASEAA
jgi:excisionase family DNA binding protein